jgi:preprotein translocase subunit SecF
MATHKPFRELVKPGSNFEFVGNARLWGTISLVLILGTFATLFVNKGVRGDYLNWSIDFAGGTEMIFEFRDQEGSLVEVDPGDVRTTLQGAGFTEFDVSEFSWTVPLADGTTTQAPGMRIRTQLFSAVDEAQQAQLADDFTEAFEHKTVRQVSWSGNRMIARTTEPMEQEEAQAFFAGFGLSMRDWSEDQRDAFRRTEAGSDEYQAQFSIIGIERQFEGALEEGLENIDAGVVQVYGVGAAAGKELRDDGIKSLFYAIALIMLYIVFRFDVRYAPGAVAALLHDALLVVGVFALTWTEVSLTSVAALLTVIGYSVNDTVVIFDRIRENVGRLKDKKFARVINISLNETLSRTLLTSLTLLAVTLVMNIFGSGQVRNFAFAMNIGAVVGVYSSMFVASPVVLALHNKYFGARPKPTPSGGGRDKGGASRDKSED